jgi:hypothetical protein
MDNVKAKRYVNDVFSAIEKAKNIQEIERIYFDFEIPEKNRINTIDYPKIEFTISKEDIEILMECGLINNSDNSFTSNITSKLIDPLAKLLYALAWKNGDLKKVKHIIRGIKESNKVRLEKTKMKLWYFINLVNF